MRITGLWAYPVKGLAGVPLKIFDVESGGTAPRDRAYAIAHDGTGFDAAAPRWLPKTRFFMQMRHECLAQIAVAFDAADGDRLTLRHAGEMAEGRLAEPAGRTAIEAFLAPRLSDLGLGQARIVHAEGHAFTDISARAVHIAAQESIEGLAAAMGQKLQPERFRANVLVAGAKPFAEAQWVGRRLMLGGVSAKVTAATGRCAATNVNPATATRDGDIPAALMALTGAMQLGVYARIATSGRIALGDEVILQA